MVSQEDVNEYNLEVDLADHSSEYCIDSLSSEKELKESILYEHPVPNNIEGVNRLDNFMRDILKDKKRSNELIVENVLEKVHSKTRDVYGLLAKMWSDLEDINSSRDGSINVDNDTLLTCK